jgi:hypothetical protein
MIEEPLRKNIQPEYVIKEELIKKKINKKYSFSINNDIYFTSKCNAKHIYPYMYSSVEIHQAYLLHMNEKNQIEWKTGQVENNNSKYEVFVWEMAMGNGKPFPQSTGEFDIFINEKKILSFCITKISRFWEKNEFTFYYSAKKTNFSDVGKSITLDDYIYNDYYATFGIALLKIPKEYFQINDQPIICIKSASNCDNSRRWIRIGLVDGGLPYMDIDEDVKALSKGRIIPKYKEYNIFFGDIHNHSNESIELNGIGCGFGKREDNFSYAKNIAGLDFYALTEHDWQMNDEDWENVQSLCDKYNKSGSFITLYAYEFTSSNYGHRNVYFLQKNGPVVKSSLQPGLFGNYDKNNPKPSLLWKEIDKWGGDAITIPHHINATQFINDLCEFHSNKYDRNVEVYSNWGSSEEDGSSDLTLCIDKNKDNNILKFLNRGLKFGLLASSDSHDGHPGNSQGTSARPQLFHYFGSGLVAVLAKELTRESVFEALKKRRCYATTGQPMVIGLSVEGYIMGEEIKSIDLNEEPTFNIFIKGTQKIVKIEIIKNGLIINIPAEAKRNLNIKWQDKEFNFEKDNYYYLKVKQVDGEVAWSSPIWILKED